MSDKLGYKVSNNMGFAIGPSVKWSLPVKGLAMEAATLFDQQSIAVETIDLMGGRSFETTLRQQQIVIPVNFHYGFSQLIT